MGQRAPLLLSELLLLLTASRALLAVSFPEDSAPLDVVDAHCEYARQRKGGVGGNAAKHTLSGSIHTRRAPGCCSLMPACLPLPSFTAVPSVQRPALWERVAASP